MQFSVNCKLLKYNIPHLLRLTRLLSELALRRDYPLPK